jgi:hypothetical protein
LIISRIRLARVGTCCKDNKLVKRFCFSFNVSSVSKCSSICVRGAGNGIDRMANTKINLSKGFIRIEKKNVQALVDRRVNSACVIFFFCSLCKTYNLRTVVA